MDRDSDRVRLPGGSAVLQRSPTHPTCPHREGPPGRRPSRWVLPALLLLPGFVAAVFLPLRFSGEAPDAAGSAALTAVRTRAPLPLPVRVNEQVERWIERFLGDQRPTFEAFLARETLYGDMIRIKLRDRGMPEDLLYLAMIESGFSTRASSPVAATGLWQFMGPTAREYGLRIDGYVDERRDPVRATDAALDYLQGLHDRFGSWYLAAAAYNAGANRVARVLRDRGEADRRDEDVYWEIVDGLPRETREYVPKLIAATILARQAERHGFEYQAVAPYVFDEVWVPGGTPLSLVAASLGATAGLVRDLNPHLVRAVTPPGVSYAVRVPPGQSDRVIMAMNRKRSGRVPVD